MAFVRSGDRQAGPLLVDGLTARALELSDGTRTAAEIVEALDREFDSGATEDTLGWIEKLFLRGLSGSMTSIHLASGVMTVAAKAASAGTPTGHAP